MTTTPFLWANAPFVDVKTGLLTTVGQRLLLAIYQGSTASSAGTIAASDSSTLDAFSLGDAAVVAADPRAVLIAEPTEPADRVSSQTLLASLIMGDT